MMPLQAFQASDHIIIAVGAKGQGVLVVRV
jgi:hypothetical protein